MRNIKIPVEWALALVCSASGLGLLISLMFSWLTPIAWIVTFVFGFWVGRHAE